MTLAVDLASALALLHSSNIVHGSLCPTRVAYVPGPDGGSGRGASSKATGSGSTNSLQLAKAFKLGGLAMARSAPPPACAVANAQLGPMTGSHPAAQHCAPERWQSTSSITAAADVFALGVLLHQVRFGGHGQSQHSALRSHVRKPVTFMHP